MCVSDAQRLPDVHYCVVKAGRLLEQSPAQKARAQLKQKADADRVAMRSRGEIRGWQQIDCECMPVWQFIPGGRMMPAVSPGSYQRWKMRNRTQLRSLALSAA